ncbi:hypothetical protein CLV49_1061 [Labedella gwakjiensis]|uniref:Uncharacterized protein n=1 Tax=Labedella gwakjiensis TaxID=390269 RepID=A0A2P8GU14_9MICO|nr:hypothetical protein [Labedella gwakjiensis]PSL37454.1 hypothetical protein CLV49_1061 [Labedella gwakjiensis]RUQ84764.1 hypothetical protein ELQ93_14340 [Labedella gwakjiensis]
MFALFLEAAAQVAVIALVLGAGLPALFALGVRSFALAGGAATTEQGGPGTPVAMPAPLLRVIGVICFAIVVIAVVVGLTIIIATGLGQVVSFEHIVPTFVPKG